MKKIHFLIVLTMMCACFVSCTKDEPTTPTISHEDLIGEWVIDSDNDLYDGIRIVISKKADSCYINALGTKTIISRNAGYMYNINSQKMRDFGSHYGLDNLDRCNISVLRIIEGEPNDLTKQLLSIHINYDGIIDGVPQWVSALFNIMSFTHNEITLWYNTGDSYMGFSGFAPPESNGSICDDPFYYDAFFKTMPSGYTKVIRCK